VIPRVSALILTFCAPDLFSTVPSASGPVFMFFRPQTQFRRYRGHRVPFSCFACPDLFSTKPRASGPVFMFCAMDSFSALQRASGPIFMFCAPKHVCGGAEGVGSRYHVLRSRTHFRRYRVCRVSFSCFAPTDSISTVPRASGPVFMFCVPRFIFDETEGVGSDFHVLRSRTRFRRHRGRRLRFSFLRARVPFWWCGGRRLLFSYFARLN
jgi:hypothetical protein